MFLIVSKINSVSLTHCFYAGLIKMAPDHRLFIFCTETFNGLMFSLLLKDLISDFILEILCTIIIMMKHKNNVFVLLRKSPYR